MAWAGMLAMIVGAAGFLLNVTGMAGMFPALRLATLPPALSAVIAAVGLVVFTLGRRPSD